VTARLFLAVAVLILVGAPLGAQATNSAATPRTLVRVSSPIDGVAQDGDRIAWLTERERPTCERVLNVRSLVTNRTQRSVGSTCYFQAVASLALAGRAGAWDSLLASGNTEFDAAMLTARPPERRAHRVASIFGTNKDGYPRGYPATAGAGELLVYSSPTGVSRIVRGKRHRLFAIANPIDVAVGGGRIAVVRQVLRPGDGCGCVSAPDWTPSGKVAFLSDLSLRGESPREEITVIDAPGSGRTVLTHDGLWRDHLTWSPGGTKVAYSYLRMAQLIIGVAGADGSNAHDVGLGDGPAWSPDDSKLAFTRMNGSSTEIFVMNATGGGEQRLANGDAPAWSPDGTRIAYTDGNGGLAMMNADGSGPHGFGFMGAHPDWSPDGAKLAFDRGGHGGGISVVRADGTSLQSLTSGWDVDPHWSPDGHTLVFASARNDVVDDGPVTFELYLVGADGSDLRPLTYRASASWATAGQVRSASGRLVSSFETPGRTGEVALTASRVVVLTHDETGAGSATLFAPASGTRLAGAALPGGSISVLGGASSRWAVFQTGRRTIRALDLRTLGVKTLAVAAQTPVGLSVSGRRVAWAENFLGSYAHPHGTARIRELVLP
jgi:Tol biopolymer transport system component